MYEKKHTKKPVVNEPFKNVDQVILLTVKLYCSIASFL